MHFMKIGILFISLAILFGCSNEAIQNKPITQKATEVETLVNQSKWDKAKQKVKIIRGLYSDNKWKYQLLGDDTEYTSLDKHISKLKVSLEEKDKQEAKLNIAMIKHYIESLYFQ